MQVTCVVSIVDPRQLTATPDKPLFLGFRVVELHIEQGKPPSARSVEEFFDVLDTEPVVAMHGNSSLCRTPLLAALYLMRWHAFSSQAAVAFIRMLRPGSVSWLFASLCT